MDDQSKDDPVLTSTEMVHLLELLWETPDTVEGEHLTEDDLALYGEGNHGEADVKRIDQHLASCETCAVRMELKLAIRRHLVVSAEEEFTFDRFMAEVEPKLKRLMNTYRIPNEHREDILQSSLLALLYQWERVHDHESWLFGTVKRYCLIYWRTNRRRIYSAVDATILEWLSNPTAPSQERSDLLRDLESLIDRLPLRCRTLLRLRFRLGYEPQEVADKLGYSASSIGKITNRCLTALSKELLASELVESLPGRRRPTTKVEAKASRGKPGSGDGG
jgi:RNA polymerase sigma factor (sigma-70 family)